MNKNDDLILNLCLQIKIMLLEVMEEENNFNEGSLSMHYKNIIELLINIETERLLQLSYGRKNYRN